MIDTFVLIALMFCAGYLFASWEDAPENARIWAFALIWLGYEPLAMTFGSTLGNYMMKIRVRRAGAEHKKINLLQAYLRYVVKLPLGWLAFLTVGSNPRRRAVHDLAAGTVVVEA